jgi:protein phosphatase
LRAGVDEANGAILKTGMGSQLLYGMGTTLVLAAFGERSVIVGHIGDSRCYRLRGGRLDQLTHDHSLLQEQLDAGLLTPEQAASSNQRNLVTRALGIESSVDLELHEHAAQPEDLYLLCSDGLTEMVSDVELFTLLNRDIDLPSLATLLVANANDNGGRDNISVVLARAVRRG